MATTSLVVYIICNVIHRGYYMTAHSCFIEFIKRVEYKILNARHAGQFISFSERV